MDGYRKPHNLRLFLALMLVFSLLLSCNFLDTIRRQADENNNQNQENNRQNQGDNDQNQNNNQDLQDQQDQNQDQQNQDQNAQENVENEEDDSMVQGHTGVWETINYGGFGFLYDPTVIEDIQPSTVPQSAGGMYDMPHPPYVKYDLFLDGGHIAVVEFPWLLEVSAPANEAYTGLELLLETHDFQDLNCIPEIPVSSYFSQCSHQQYHANVAFIDFANGSGVRFVTTYGIQDTVAISNESIAYVFQGFTDDGQCFVKASFRLTHEDLEEFGTVPPEVYADSSGDLLREYFEEYRDLLENNPDGYMPGLERFDLIIESIQVDYCTSG